MLSQHVPTSIVLGLVLLVAYSVIISIVSTHFPAYKYLISIAGQQLVKTHVDTVTLIPEGRQIIKMLFVFPYINTLN